MNRKGLKGKALLGLSTMAIAIMLTGSYGMVTYASEGFGVEDSENEGIALHSDIIEYRYKIVDGTKVYRRLYNYSKECWVGEWEYVGEGFIEPGM